MPNKSAQSPSVINFKNVSNRWDKVSQRFTDDALIYCGRANSTCRLPDSPFGNPFVIKQGGLLTRESAISSFEEYLKRTPDLLLQCPSLRGKGLVCWCAPQACHCDVLVKYAMMDDETLAAIAKKFSRYAPFYPEKWNAFRRDFEDNPPTIKRHRLIPVTLTQKVKDVEACRRDYAALQIELASVRAGNDDDLHAIKAEMNRVRDLAIEMKINARALIERYREGIEAGLPSFSEMEGFYNEFN